MRRVLGNREDIGGIILLFKIMQKRLWKDLNLRPTA